MLRIQRSRALGWRMPSNTISCSRPGTYGNPFPFGPDCVLKTAKESVDAFRHSAESAMRQIPESRRMLEKLRGHNLACWCKLCPEHKAGKPLNLRCEACAPCHVDALGEILAGMRDA